MPPIDHALAHRARVLRTVRDRASARNAQGEYEPEGDEPGAGPWFAARRMSRRASAEQQVDGERNPRRRRETAWSLLFGLRCEDGSPVVVRASDEVEVEVYGQTFRYQVAGEPEDFDSGYERFGGQADLVVIGDSAA